MASTVRCQHCCMETPGVALDQLTLKTDPNAPDADAISEELAAATDEIAKLKADRDTLAENVEEVIAERNRLQEQVDELEEKLTAPAEPESEATNAAATPAEAASPAPDAEPEVQEGAATPGEGKKS